VRAPSNPPTIGASYGLEEAAGHRYLILEYIEGETLADRLKRGPIPIDEALPIARQIAEALEAAHEKSVIHRDLKPGNVMVTTEGHAKVLDFGLARTAEGTPTSSSYSAAVADSPTITSPMPIHSPTIAGVIMGTAGYMSPEQARGKPVDKRSDIFSFGCVFYEMLTGIQPFSGETATDSIGAILHRDPNWALLPPNTPARVRDLLTNCLAKDRKQRLHDMGDARLELERAIAGKEWGSAAPNGRQPRRLLPTLLIGVSGALAMLALGAGLWRTFGSPSVGSPEPRCVTISMPPDIIVRGATLSDDGRTLVAIGRPRNPGPSGIAEPRLYARPLERYDFAPIAGTEGANWGSITRDGRSVLFPAKLSQASTNQRLASVPIDGSAPATTILEFSVTGGGFIELANGDTLFADSPKSFVRIPKGGGERSAPTPMDAGRPSIVRFEWPERSLPGDRRVLVNVVTYGARGFQTGIGVLEIESGRVRVIVEDGGQAAYSPTGHLVFSRGDTLLAAPFDPERGELRGAPVAVWGGLSSDISTIPGYFQLTTEGTLIYPPAPPGGWNYTISILGADGKLQPWSSDLKFLNNITPSPDGRRVLIQNVNVRNIDEFLVSSVDHADFVKLTSEANVDSVSGVWSPDGKQIAYTRVGKDDADGIYIQSADSGVPRRVFKPASIDQFASPTAWLADDSALLISLRDLATSKSRIMRLPLGKQETDAAGLSPVLPSEFNRVNARLSSNGRVLAFGSDESGKAQTWVVELRPGGETGRPIQVKTLGSQGHAWAPDGITLHVLDERRRLQKTTVTLEPQISLSAPVEVGDFEKLGIDKWTPISDGRFLVNFKLEGFEDVKTFSIVFNWTETLKKKVPVAK